MTPASLYERLGANAFEPALFYANTPALRFDLSRTGGALELFIQAFDRAREILDFAFAASKHVIVVLAIPSDGPLVRSREVFRAVNRCGIPPLTPEDLMDTSGRG